MAETANAGASDYEKISVAVLRGRLAGPEEIAFLDVREEGQHGAGHPLLAVNTPYSRFEPEVVRLVPRRGCPVVLVDDADGVAARAAHRLRALGYRDIRVLTGGTVAWATAGYPLFPSSNVPSKAFAEIMEHGAATPAVSATELDRMRREGADVVVLDSRPAEEYARFHVPGAINCPGAELVHRFSDVVRQPNTFVVVSCAGRTRGIIGAQSLINAQVPNQVAALAGGTQGWRLAGFELESGAGKSAGAVSKDAADHGRRRAARIDTRFKIRHIDQKTLALWRSQADQRTTCLLDVRSPEEFAAGHLPGSVSAPGGQLVQAIDRWVGTRGARLVLIDDNGTRAIMTAHWLLQMGWNAQVLDYGLEGVRLETAIPAPPRPDLPPVTEIEPAQAADWLAQGAAAVSLDPSGAYREGHPEGAVWAIRPRLDRLPASVLAAARIVLFADDAMTARLAAIDLAGMSQGEVAAVRGGTAAWRQAGLPIGASPEQPPDVERIDFIFWNHDRHAGNRTAMEAYLRWETELPMKVAADGLSGFRLGVGGR